MEWLLVVRWLAVLAVLAAVGAPLSAWLFAPLSRRGAAFALPVSLLGFALVVFWVGQVTFGLHTLVAGVGVVAAASALAYRRGVTPEWRSVAGAYAVFAAGFLLLVVFRASEPGITPAGGEQFLHFGLTKALSRAPSLPPEDFWFAGEPLRYYYGSQLQVTGLSMLTGTPMRFGFNLGVATFYGVLAVSAYGLAGAVSDAAGYSYRLGGTLGVFFTAVAGALTTAVRLAFGLLDEDTAVRYGHAAFDGIRHMPYEEAVLTQSDPAEWFWFYTRYVVPGTLQEFPLYSFVKADLHGHALSTGYVVVAAALAYSYYRLPAERRGRRLVVLLGGLGAVAGVFGFMNTWSLPTAAGLAWLAVAGAPAHPATLLPGTVGDRLVLPDAGGTGGRLRRAGGELWRLALAVVPAALVGLVGVALSAPFLVFGHVPQNQGLGLFPPRTALGPFLVIYGAILALLAAYLLVRGWPALDRLGGRTVAAVAGAGVVAVALATALSAPALAVAGPLVVAGWWLVRTDRAGFAAVLLVAGVGLVLSMELVFAKVAPWPEGPPRWNTSLKVAVQGWTLAGVAAGAAGAVLLGRARTALSGLRARTGRVRAVAPAVLAGALVVAAVLASSPFVVLAATHEVGDAVSDDRRMTLDGLAVHERWKGDQMAAIEWLDERQGRPTVAEAPGRSQYRWTSPASTMTGLPALVGWTHHQENYRGSDRVDRRAVAADRVFVDRWESARRVLREHDVRYVYVGPNERERYGDAIRDFGRRDALSVAFENDAVTVYAVDRSALEAA